MTSKTGLDLDTSYIEALSIPGNLLIALVEFASNRYIEKEFGTSILTMVSEVDISPSRLQVYIQMPDDLNNNSQSTKCLYWRYVIT